MSVVLLRFKSFAGKGATTRYLRSLHVYSAVLVFLLMLFFAVTGFYLNHPELEAGKVSLSQQELRLPEWLAAETWRSNYSENVLRLLQWLDSAHGIRGVDFAVEYDEVDSLLIIDLSGPNGHSLVEVSVEEGRAVVDRRKLSLLASLNNVHRAKHVTGLWRYLSDFSALCMLLFCLSGFWLALINKMQRKSAALTTLLGSAVFFLVLILMH